MDRGAITLKNETLAELPAFMISRGMPLPPGKVMQATDISITDDKGNALPSSAKVLQRRDDGSIEWALVDAMVPLTGQQKRKVYIVPKAAPQPKVDNPVTVKDDGSLITLSNGITSITLNRAGGSIIHKLVMHGKTLVEPGMVVEMELRDTGDKIYRASHFGAYAITVTHQNALRTEVKLEGKHTSRDGVAYIDFALRFTLKANTADVKFEHTFYAREPREGKYAIKSMRLIMPTTMDPAATKLLRQSHHGHTWFHRDVEIKENIEVVASSVGDIDLYASTAKGPGVSHPSAGGSIFLRNMDSFKEDWSKYPFHMRPGQGSGFRADLQIGGVRGVEPIVTWKSKDFSLVTTFEQFRQLHPKSIEIDENVLTWSIWPIWSTPMQVVMGVSKSHIFYLTGEPRELTVNDAIDKRGGWTYNYYEPVDMSFDPAWPAYCQALECHEVLKFQPLKFPMLENLIEVASAAGNPDRHTYDRHPSTGMFHFGDHVSNDAASCVNNEDDIAVFFPLQEYLRTGNMYAWDHGKEAARHYMEVDFCEFSTDPRQRGGLIPHTGQHFIGNVYPSHQWAEGILAYYYLTGDERAKNVVIACGDNNVYWAFNVIEAVVCDGREAGMPLVNLAAAYRLTRDAKYIEAAKHICESFFVRWTDKDGNFRYPYPQGTTDHPHKLITGYGDWSSFAGLYRLWQVTGDEYFKKLGVQLLNSAIKPGGFSLNDARGMDFLAAYALGVMTGDMDDVIERVKAAVPMLLRRGGHPLRRLHFLKVLDDKGLIDDKAVGNRGGVI